MYGELTVEDLLSWMSSNGKRASKEQGKDRGREERACEARHSWEMKVQEVRGGKGSLLAQWEIGDLERRETEACQSCDGSGMSL